MDDAEDTAEIVIGYDPHSIPDQIGHCRIERLLHVGRTGRVFLGIESRLQKLVAIKVPEKCFVSTKEQLDACLSQAILTCKVSRYCPYIAQIYFFETSEEFACYIVSRYVDGIRLGEFCRTDLPSLDQSASIILELAEALQKAHTSNLFHLHLSPWRILMDRFRNPCLPATDFIRFDRSGEEHWFFGNVGYMSPEQVAGKKNINGPAADIFSLGLILFFLLTGRRPYFAQGGAELCAEIIDQRIAAPSQFNKQIPREFDEICLKAMAKRPENRYRSMSDFAAAVRRLQRVMKSLRKPKGLP